MLQQFSKSDTFKMIIMKTLLLILTLSLTGCASVGAYITTHQVTIAAVGVTAGATAAMTSTAVNVVTLEKDAKGK